MGLFYPLPADEPRFRLIEDQEEGFYDTHGPFEYNGKSYGFFVDTILHRVESWVSADDENWALVDGANSPVTKENTEPPQQGQAYWETCSVAFHNAEPKAYVAYIAEDHIIKIKTFDFSLGTNGEWTTTLVTPADMTAFDVVGSNPYPEFWLVFDHAAPGFVLVYSTWDGVPSGTNKNHVFRIYESGSWGSAVSLHQIPPPSPGGYDYQGLVIDDAGLLHFFERERTVPTQYLPRSFRHRGYDRTSGFGSSQTIDTVPFPGSPKRQRIGGGRPIIDNGEILYPYRIYTEVPSETPFARELKFANRVNIYEGQWVYITNAAGSAYPGPYRPYSRAAAEAAGFREYVEADPGDPVDLVLYSGIVDHVKAEMKIARAPAGTISPTWAISTVFDSESSKVGPQVCRTDQGFSAFMETTLIPFDVRDEPYNDFDNPIFFGRESVAGALVYVWRLFSTVGGPVAYGEKGYEETLFYTVYNPATSSWSFPVSMEGPRDPGIVPLEDVRLHRYYSLSASAQGSPMFPEVIGP